MSRLPDGAQEIWDMRMQRKKPNEIVFVSLIGPLNSGNYQVFINDKDRVEQLDFRWVIDLSVCIVFNNRVPNARVSELVKAIARHAPNGGYSQFNKSFGYLWLWDASKQDGFLVSWWAGVTGIPELDIPTQPEDFTKYKLSRWERISFEGVAADEWR